MDPKKGIKPFFVQRDKKAGSVTFLPSPSGRDIKQNLNKSKLDLPNSKIFNEIMGYAENMKNDIDISKTVDEINMIKKMENQQADDEYMFKKTRTEALKG